MDIVWANNAKLVKLNAENMFNMIEKILGFNVLLEKCLSKTISGMPFSEPWKKGNSTEFLQFSCNIFIQEHNVWKGKIIIFF